MLPHSSFLSCVGFKKDSYYLALLTGKCTSFFPSLSRNGTKMFSFLYLSRSRVLFKVSTLLWPVSKAPGPISNQSRVKIFRVKLKNFLLGADSEVNVYPFFLLSRFIFI